MPKILVPSLIIFAIILIMLIVTLNKTLDKQAYLQIYLTDSELEWKLKDSSDKQLVASIESIGIKRNTKGLIREIGIGISGKKFREPIDFDHPLFYVFLGVIVGIVLTLIFRLSPLLNEDNIKYVQFSIACFIIVGIFWIINKPIRGRYGKKNIIADYIWGVSLLSIGVLIIISSKIFW